MYGASDQNWSITQDSMGRLFVANLNGVMMYDGEYWKVIPIKNNLSCVSLIKAKDETIYVGAANEFGYLDFSDNDSVKYKSLSVSLPKSEKDFGNVWAVHAIGDDIFFCSNERIFWYRNNVYQKSFTPTGEKFHTFFNVGNTLLVREQGVGLLFFKDGNLKKILGTGELANTKVYAALSQKENVYWLCSRNGLYSLYFNINKPEISNLIKINSSVDKWMTENDVYYGTKLSEDMFALGSIKKGMLLVDKDFKKINTINYDNGLQDDAVKYIYKDFSGNIWLALNKGVSYIEINSPITFFGKSNNVTNTIESIAKLNDILYIATDKGISQYDSESHIFKSTEITDESWDLACLGNTLFAGTESGLYKFEDGKISHFPEIADRVRKIFFLPDKRHVYLASIDYLIYAEYKNGKINILKTFDYARQIESFAIDSNNCVFFGTSSEVVYMRDPLRPDTLISFFLKDHFNNQIIGVNASKCNNSIALISDKAIFKPVSYPNVTIIEDPSFKIPELKKSIFYSCVPFENEVWFAAATINDFFNLHEDPVFIVLRPPSSSTSAYSIVKNHFLYRIRGVSKIHCHFVDTSLVYLGTENGLYVYDLKKKETFYKFNSFISRIRINNESTNYAENYTNRTSLRIPEISYKNNKITFYLSASDFFNVKLLEFSYYLEGKENSFGDWTTGNEISYSDLAEGKYTFHLKSKNILGVESNPLSFTFTILPPWYRTYWAYAIYLIGSVSLIWLIVRFNTKRLKEQNIKLENIVLERTKEVAHQKEEIEHKNQEITDSINYAKRIQQAILPPMPEIKKAWEDIFVFYQPKDIVSGDFYWFHRINNNEILIACADCTGHGVPGGFMSMICSDKLNDAVKQTQDPAEILFHVNNNVKLALRQVESTDENANKDGMEISLLKINFSSKKVWYAGANRPLWLLRNNMEELEEIKPTKASIASFTKTNFVYEGHELQLASNDLIYLTSDGYPDQFGGENGKKFMTKNLKKLISSIKSLPITNQEETVKNIINQWMKGYEQVDDLLVIGIKM